MVGSGLADHRSPLTAGPLRRFLNFDRDIVIFQLICISNKYSTTHDKIKTLVYP